MASDALAAQVAALEQKFRQLYPPPEEQVPVSRGSLARLGRWAWLALHPQVPQRSCADSSSSRGGRAASSSSHGPHRPRGEMFGVALSALRAAWPRPAALPASFRRVARISRGFAPTLKISLSSCCGDNPVWEKYGRIRGKSGKVSGKDRKVTRNFTGFCRSGGPPRPSWRSPRSCSSWRCGTRGCAWGFGWGVGVRGIGRCTWTDWGQRRAGMSSKGLIVRTLVMPH